MRSFVQTQYMRKLLLLVALIGTSFTMNAQLDPPGCYTFGMLDNDGDGVVTIDIPVFKQYMFTFFYNMTGFDASVSYYLTHDVLYPDQTQTTYTYTQGVSQWNIDTSYIYTGSGEQYTYTDYHLSMNYLGCMIPELYDPNGDEDEDGIPNVDEDTNGDGVLENDDSDGDGVPNYRQSALGVKDVNKNPTSVYPNPAISKVSISNADANSVVSVFDLNGRKLKQLQNVSDIDVSDLASGVYLLQISSDTKSQTIRFVKQ